MMKVAEPEIASQTFGDPAHPPILLIMGAMASMLWWPEAFCRKLAGKGLFVIRYDNRDTGRSTKYAPGEPPYTFDDMADDAIRVLDGYCIAKAHVVGMSMGGMIAQLVALKHPSRVISLTAISTSPVGTDTSHLPGMTEVYRKHSAEGADVDWSDRDQVVDFIVKDAHAIAGTAHPFDEKRMRAFVEQDYDRSGGFLSATNHFMLKSSEDRGGEDGKGRLHELKVPLLVIHGTDDPIFPIEHGAALAEAVAGAKLVRIEGGGHELHPDDWAVIVDAIVTHTHAR
ncbi:MULTISPECIES: alpha/beta fold hydrolase [unclassified Mesorhizobium]|uniref:alpha/beta fold hydrolase n=1 Tax=unclassified Mesorhizobium TaxID=325217 RepID=UPI000F75FFD3|nr:MULTISPECIES: alpha/beta hydrolase [unclassified Mesorhizobium]AZO65784.1 alpha/beta hydrolase [Mesorhizobium sp. M6A.T.Cr.TU.016.01.1.1]RUU38906.1 alpha/beta fold hydrolase [Mesorhizobium sp. M6A.T.Ce.TU.002.03.1.1]RUV01816.1 alpha/beta fold hydrolase [Mesorhizobium sp. M6A.T.Cr.TU.017.01.1.1]RWP53480.1 MAG: alpha/beta fold hydrolase [Mesorhizobium sp.]RWP78631.1 MAG: alpha/beta fold hydrolase [Mesorhizobium sp.]